MIRARGRTADLFLALVAALLVLALVHFLVWGVAVVRFPYGIDYGEGIVWQQMNAIVGGHGYAPVHGFPAIVFHYPPVYHLLAAAVSSTGLPPLMAGRLLSLLAILASTALVGVLTVQSGVRHASRRAILMGAAFAGVSFTTLFAVRYWSPLMRVDSVACLTQLAGLSFAIASLRRPALIYAAAVAFVLSVFTKQTELPGPAAAFGVLLLARPGLALRGIGTCAVLGLLALGTLMWATDGRAYDHLFLYNLNSFSWEDVVPRIRHAIYATDKLPLGVGLVTAAVVAVALVFRPERRDGGWRALLGDRWGVAHAILLVFLALKTTSLTALGKGGAAANYMIEWYAPMCVYVGIAAAWLLHSARLGTLDAVKRLRLLPAACALLVALWLAFVPRTSDLPNLPAAAKDAAATEQALAGVRGPIISEDMAMLLRTGREVLWEPAIFAELAKTGHYDESAVVRAIATGQVAAMVTSRQSGEQNDRYTPAVTAAMARGLPLEVPEGHWVIHLPATH